MSTPSATEPTTAKPVASDTSKPPRQRPNPTKEPAPQTEPPKRRKPRTQQANRAYYVAEVDAAGEIKSMILKLPTIGQARKARSNAAKCAKISESMTRLVRVVVVE